MTTDFQRLKKLLCDFDVGYRTERLSTGENELIMTEGMPHVAGADGNAVVFIFGNDGQFEEVGVECRLQQ